jgi:acyl-CoA synthetase (AMP-forming)/AMP-acid ligase II
MICRYVNFLKTSGQDAPDSPAILAPGRTALTYRALWEHVQAIAAQLNSAGFGRGDRIAIVLPNGPEMAACFLAVSACATSAPLNPAYSESEFDYYLSDLRARALIVGAGMDSPAVAVARRSGLAVLELTPAQDSAAGIFDLRIPAGGISRPNELAEPADTAIVLHTSGTTSRPKIVPLAHANIAASAVQIRDSLALTAADRCLNVMPLFHIHGLIGALLSSLTAGASVVCTPGFQAGQFFAWTEEFQPTWYTAVPTMHQSIVRSAGGGTAQAAHRFRFIRSCSSALPPKTMADLESLFDVPVIEAYGMTEASHQMASNPLPPRERKPGSVGVAAGPEVGIMDETGSLLAAGEQGEIVVRGPNVMSGYEANPEANRTSFAGNWFRTGDRGYIDTAGYLFLVSRIKELINRGGEKISPREIDEVLLQHPAIEQALAFALPHPTLGEDVAAAIVLRSTETIAESEIREFASARLAPFKVPRRIVFVKEIPKGPTGKPQRIGLAEKLGIKAAPEANFPPRNELERTLVEIWKQVLGVAEVGIHDDFFELGGDSITATQAAARLHDALNVDVTVAAFFDHPTISSLSETMQAAKPAHGSV